MKKRVTNVLIWLAILVLLLPATFIITMMIFPFWRWLEQVSGIESFGHSGPAEWCYWLIYFLFIVIIGIFRHIMQKNKD